MKYINNYKEYNEGIKSRILKAGLVGGLLSNSIHADAINKETIKQEIQNPRDGVLVAKNQVQALNKIRKTHEQKDEDLNKILLEIKSNVDNNCQDPKKLKELYEKLANHLEKKYNFKIEKKEIPNISKSGYELFVKKLSIIEILGWLGSVCLALCGVPQAWQTLKEKHSEGISWGFVILWALGEIFALAYVYDKLDLPLLLNYSANILILSIILYYKINPKNDDKELQSIHK